MDKYQSQWGGMCRNFINWWLGLAAWWLGNNLNVNFLIEISVVNLPTIAKRPTVIFTLFNNVYFIRRQIIPQKVATHFSRPDFGGLGIKSEKDAISKAFGKNLTLASLGIYLQNGTISLIFFDADITSGTNGNVKLTIRTKADGSGEVTTCRRQIDD